MNLISEKLIDKISSVLDIIYDPFGLKKGQRDFTNALFNKIANCEDLNINIEERMAVINEYKLLLLKNKNRKNIVEKACENLKDNASPSSIDNSWLLNFWDKSGTITDVNLQEIWGKVLAQQANMPNSISKRLLHNLFLMSKNDADNFSILASFWFDDNKYNIAHPLVFIKNHPVAYKNWGLTTDILNELASFSLIETNYETGFAFESQREFFYKNYSITVKKEHFKEHFSVGNVRLTEDGQKLYKIIDKYKQEKILEYTIERLLYRNCYVDITTENLF